MVTGKKMLGCFVEVQNQEYLQRDVLRLECYLFDFYQVGELAQVNYVIDIEQPE